MVQCKLLSSDQHLILVSVHQNTMIQETCSLGGYRLKQVRHNDPVSQVEEEMRRRRGPVLWEELLASPAERLRGRDGPAATQRAAPASSWDAPSLEQEHTFRDVSPFTLQKLSL